jgi:hypothetical protein
VYVYSHKDEISTTEKKKIIIQKQIAIKNILTAQQKSNLWTAIEQFGDES